MQQQLEALAEYQVRRKFFIGAINRNTNAAGARVRRALGCQSDDDEAKREKVKAKAAKIVSDALNGRGCALPSVASDLAVIARSIEPLTKARHECELAMKRLMRKLPIWEQWAKGVRGLGELGCAVILAETGNLGNYATRERVWKRLGLAPLNGKAMSTWRKEGGLTADDWTAAGYSPRRRAEIFSCVGDPLFRQQTMVVGPYRQAYDTYKAKQTALNEAGAFAEQAAGIVKAAKKAGRAPLKVNAEGRLTPIHIHNRATRFMTKELIRDLWSEWRRASSAVITTHRLPAADYSSLEERPANPMLKPKREVPGVLDQPSL